MEKNEQTLGILRHSTSHIMAQAVQNLFPQAKLAIGPSTDTGFYYDFDLVDGYTFTPDLHFMNGHAVCNYCGSINCWEYSFDKS